MAKPSAGLLIYRFKENKLEVFLVHPGGPLWQRKDEWSIPKGEYTAEEEPLNAAKREFIEETGFEVPSGTQTCQAAKRQSSQRMGDRRGFRRGENGKQYVLVGMAAEIGQT